MGLWSDPEALLIFVCFETSFTVYVTNLYITWSEMAKPWTISIQAADSDSYLSIFSCAKQTNKTKPAYSKATSVLIYYHVLKV